MKKCLSVFMVCFLMCFMMPHKAKADIEAIQALITSLGDKVEGAKEKILKVKSTKLKADELSANASKYKEKAEKTAKDAKEKANKIKNKATGGIKGLSGKELSNQAENTEFAGLDGTFDGTKEDDEMEEAIVDALVRKPGADSVTSQKELSAALNQKMGTDAAEMYGKAFVLRQDLAKETDEYKKPEAVDEAIKVYEDVKIKSMKRWNSILEMEGALARMEHTKALESQEGKDNAEAEHEI